MPQQVSKAVPANRVRAGDEVQQARVTSVSVKAKYVYIEREGAPRLRVARDEEVVVVRQEPTEEEKAAQRLKDQLEEVAAWVRRAKGLLEAARDNLAKALHAGSRVSPEEVRSLLAAQKQAEIALQLEAIVENTEGADLASAAERLVKALARRLIDGHNEPTWSGGFSLNNAQRQIENEVARDFISSMGYAGIRAI